MRNLKSGASFWWIVVAIVVVLAAIGSGVVWFLSTLANPEIVLPIKNESQPEVFGSRTVSLAYINDFGTISEQLIVIPTTGEIESDLIATLNALAAAPDDENLITAIPVGTKVMAAFYDPNKKSAVIDFSSELVSAHPGGTAAEHATINVIMTTIARNFPKIDTCLILVDKAQCETLAGHIELDRTFNLQEWR
ncbi:MAG: GerMN domain-containing protein [bacterium]|nr:GerMN domain-containing protein [bacterium]MCP4799757.1 GerMN domain-containing protein [bacterium]